MGFLDAYKRLEKLCGEILNDDHGISAYIDEMKSIPGAFYVSGWRDDLEQLKHYRWVRNQIAHEPGCTEENMCDASDTQWLIDFYARIMNQTDPLALYRKATQREYPSTRPDNTRIETGRITYQKPAPYQNQDSHRKQEESKGIGCLFCLLLTAVILVAIWCLTQ